MVGLTVSRCSRAVLPYGRAGRWVGFLGSVVLVFTHMALAQTGPNVPAGPPFPSVSGGAATPASLAAPGAVQALPSAAQVFPYTAEIIGTDVYVRSGPSANQYYPCGKLNLGDKVEVVQEQGDWAQIVPPAGSFSWLAMQAVAVNLQDPTLAVITAETANVYAGSDQKEPIHSTSQQTTLRRGTRVKLLGGEKDDYYRIAPPTGAYLWVTKTYVRPLKGPPVALPPGTPPLAGMSAPAGPNVPPAESAAIKAFNALQDKVNAEKAKPIPEQDYTTLKKALKELAGKKDDQKAATYAQGLLRRIQTYEVVQQVAKKNAAEDKQLGDATARIRASEAESLQKVADLGKYTAVGKLATSSMYSGSSVKRYRLLDEAGKTKCFVIGVGASADLDLKDLVDHKVGLMGAVKPDSSLGEAVVEFTTLTKLD